MTDDERVQAFIDGGNCSTQLDLSPWPSITTLPLRIPNTVKTALCKNCTRLTSVAGLPEGVTYADFSGCASLTSVIGLPKTLRYANFSDCTSLTSVTGLPEMVRSVYFIRCITIMCVAGLPESVTAAYFVDVFPSPVWLDYRRVSEKPTLLDVPLS